MIHTPEWWAFLLLLPPVYWLSPLRWRNWILVGASLALISVFAPIDLLVMLTLSASVFMAFRLDDTRSPPWVVALAQSLWPLWIVLIYFFWSKYLPGIARAVGGAGSFLDVAVPLGVSYFSFKLLHYAIEMRRGNFPEHGVADFSSWLFLAPIFTAGPIERFEHFLREREQTAFETRFLTEGSLRIIRGLVKKFVLGTLVLLLIQKLTDGGLVSMSNHLEDFSPPVIWAALLLALLYVYLDFSAYTDIAIGSARLFGIRIMENFNLPFLATSLQNFWQRWHMTLANWCRSYIYMPMIGITRNPYWAVIATFLVMGVWHSAGPHWVAWGLWHGMGLTFLLHWSRFAAKRKIKIMKTPAGKIAGWAMTMCYVALGGAFTAMYQQAPFTASLAIIASAFGVTFSAG